MRFLDMRISGKAGAIRSVRADWWCKEVCKMLYLKINEGSGTTMHVTVLCARGALWRTPPGASAPAGVSALDFGPARSPKGFALLVDRGLVDPVKIPAGKPEGQV